MTVNMFAKTSIFKPRILTLKWVVGLIAAALMMVMMSCVTPENGETAGGGSGETQAQDSQEGTARPDSEPPAGQGSDDFRDSRVVRRVGDWLLAWNDEFSGTSLDRGKWTFDLGNGFFSGQEWVPGWGNNELEYYTDRPSNVSVRDGRLFITAIKEEITAEAGGKQQTFSYTSTKIKSKGLFSKAYGRFEFRAKLPVGKGLWPALWLLPEDEAYGTWAASGEIDVMEAWGSKPDRVAGTIHYGGSWPNNRFTGEEYEFPDERGIGSWHVYALEWEPGELRWYVDNKLFQTQNRWNTENAPYPAPFDKRFFIIMNLAVGGNFDGNPGPDTRFPANMEIDYVRVYELGLRDYRAPVEPARPSPVSRPAEARAVSPDGNEIWNSDFTEDLAEGEKIQGLPGSSHWIHLQLPEFGGSGRVAFEPVNGTRFARIDISKPGTQPYSVQLIQRAPVLKGHSYRLSFTAKADQDRSIQVKINGDADRGWVGYSPVKDMKLSTGLQEYELVFTMEQNSDVKARVEFNVGLKTSSVWIGRVRLEDISDRQ